MIMEESENERDMWMPWELLNQPTCKSKLLLDIEHHMRENIRTAIGKKN